jgi:osmotically-inducible protein OsmY
MLKTDMQLQRDVMEELHWDPAVGRAEIGVSAKDGVVTLNGNVDSFAMKYAAVRATERVQGVRAIAEELKVVLPSASRRTDTEIAHAVADRLQWDINVPDGAVRARVENGWVWLEGETDWEYQRAAAERSTRYLTGVKGVTNQITLKKHASVADVRQRIESAFRRHAELDAHQISLETTDGRVILRGTVRSWAAREDAERAAWSAPGVTAVDDQLAVGA